MGIQHVLEDLCGSTCLRPGRILISRIKLLSENFLLHVYFTAGCTGPCTWEHWSLPVTHPTQTSSSACAPSVTPNWSEYEFPQRVLRKFLLQKANKKTNSQLNCGKTDMLHVFEELFNFPYSYKLCIRKQLGASPASCQPESF